MIKPTVETVLLQGAEMTRALNNLVNNFTLPDGGEVVDQRTMSIFRKQIADGYYVRLVWPSDATKDQILEWYDMTARVLRLHKLGLI